MSVHVPRGILVPPPPRYLGVSWSFCQRVQVYLGLSVNVSRCILVCLSTCPGVSWSVCRRVQVYLGLSVDVSRCILVCLSTCPGVSWSVCQCVQVYLGLSVNVSRCILALYGLVNNCSTNNEGSDVSTRSFHLVIAIADILNILNSCLNIVVYCLTGTRFRREVKQLLLCRSCLASYRLFCPPRELPPLLSASRVTASSVCLASSHSPSLSLSLESFVFAAVCSVSLCPLFLPGPCHCSAPCAHCSCERACVCVCVGGVCVRCLHEFSVYTYGWHIITYCYSL